jgi:alpha-ribazole phosphatase
MLRLPSAAGATRLVLMRHVATDESCRARVHGALDAPLSVTGRRAAEHLAAWLAEVPFQAVYASPLRRALETAEALAKLHGLRPVVHEDLREIEFGELEGSRYEDVEASRPELFRSWMRQPTRTRFPGGESFVELRARVLPAAESIRSRHAGATIAVVAHGGVTRTILAAALGIPDEALFRLDQCHGGLSVVDWFGEEPVVRLMNATPPG